MELGRVRIALLCSCLLLGIDLPADPSVSINSFANGQYSIEQRTFGPGVYLLEHSRDLEKWNPFGSPIDLGDPSASQITDRLSTSVARFYRLRLLPENIDETRPFFLGFTPFPYDVTEDGLLFGYEAIRRDGDLVVQHFDDGIPWPEAYSGDDYKGYHPAYVQEWEARKAHTPAGHKVYLAITPVSIARNSIAPYRGQSGDESLPEGWENATFTEDRVKTAFLNHAINAIDFFVPDYLAIGIESNLLMALRSDLWQGYLELHQFVFEALKERYPELPIMVSLAGMDLVEGYTEANHSDQVKAFGDIMPFSDFFGISLYPFISRFLANEIPDTLFDELFALSEKPIAITETGYPAQSLTFVANGQTIDIQGASQKQSDYFQGLLEASSSRNVVFIANFITRDYDDMADRIQLEGIDLLWRDTGFYDESGVERPVLQVWRSYLRKPVAPQN